MVVRVTAKRSIVTIGFCPSWDMTYRCSGLDWGDHKQVSKPAIVPAGKALNVSKALAWMGNQSTAAGLWGQEDYKEVMEELAPWTKYLKPSFTPVPGRTRRNLTLIDSLYRREIHLRESSELNSNRALQELRSDLEAVVDGKSLCVFAGLFPYDKFRSEELSELVGENIPNRANKMSQAGKGLLNRVEIILISRGEKGAIVLSQDAILRARCISGGRRVITTVGCGDYLLAGFLRGMTEKQNLETALRNAIQAATAKAWGWTESMSWSQVTSKIRVNIR